jgi:hypothetical protein
LSEDKVNGKVKMITAFGYAASEKSGKPQKEKLNWKQTKVYNEDGNVITLCNYSPDGELVLKFIYEYDKSKNVSRKKYARNGDLWELAKYTYDKNGNVSECFYFDAKGLFQYKEVSKYDVKGKLVETIDCNSDNSMNSKYIYSYENGGQKMEIKLINKDNSIRSIQRNIYDENGNLMENNNIDEKGTITTKRVAQYQNFDEYKNWKKQVWFHDDKVSLITEREIEYFAK